MRVPDGVKVNPTTEHLLSHFRDRTQAKELAMHTADAAIHFKQLLDIFASECRKYAANDDCSHSMAIKTAGKALEPMAVTLAAMSAELCLLHAVHHPHGDPIQYGIFLDQSIAGMAQVLVKIQEAQDFGKAQLDSPDDAEAQLAEILFKLLGLR